MARIAYVNGRYRPLHNATVAAEDRGYQFADGVYEVIKVLDGRARDLERHLDRLERSLAAPRSADDPTGAGERAVRDAAAEPARGRSLISRSRAAPRRAIICSRSGPAPRW